LVNSDHVVIEVDVFPLQRECFAARSQASIQNKDDEHSDMVRGHCEQPFFFLERQDMGSTTLPLLFKQFDLGMRIRCHEPLFRSDF
jgi:hypothetical protein